MKEIRSKIKQLSNPKYKYICNYILEHEEIEEITAQEISENCYCSAATVSRFCKKLGLQNFYELKFLLSHTKYGDFDEIHNKNITEELNSQIKKGEIFEKIKEKHIFIIANDEITEQLNFNIATVRVITVDDFLDLDFIVRLNSCVFIIEDKEIETEKIISDQLSHYIVLSYDCNEQDYCSWSNVAFLKLNNNHVINNFELYYIINLCHLQLKEDKNYKKVA